MPLVPHSDYRPPVPFRAAHINTIYPTFFRPTPKSAPYRERLELKDGDFLDIDWHRTSQAKAKGVAVISHGLEGNSRKKYIVGMARATNSIGWDAVCLNFRGCSGEMNRLPRLYHSGVTDDLDTVLRHCLEKGGYGQAAVIGFSMGGNQTLKYLGETPQKLPPQLLGGVAFSVPCDLTESCRVIGKPSNRIYMEHFMKGLHDKVRQKARTFPSLYPTTGLGAIRSFIPFDDAYTAPVHGFRSAFDYYQRCSSLQFLSSIKVPTLLVQAKDDPFLSPSCYPYEEARQNDQLWLETPRYGGHVGFMNGFGSQPTWAETRTANFLHKISAGVS